MSSWRLNIKLGMGADLEGEVDLGERDVITDGEEKVEDEDGEHGHDDGLGGELAYEGEGEIRLESCMRR